MLAVEGHDKGWKEDNGTLKATKVTKQCENIVSLPLLLLYLVSEVYIDAKTWQL